MAKHDTNFEAAREAKLGPREALAVTRGVAGAPPATREGALACFLSAADGWDEAARRLDGAFADCPALRTKKD